MSPSDRKSADAHADGPAAPPSFMEACRWWLMLGCISFGGPAAQIALMHREVVERRRWLDEARFGHALAYCTLLPGPEAQQLATYVGWLLHGVRGGLAAGLLFVLPSLLLLTAIAALYVAWGHLPAAVGAFAAVRPVVVAVVLHAALRLARRLRGGPLLPALACLGWLVTATGALPFPALIAAALLLGLLAGRRPDGRTPPASAASLAGADGARSRATGRRTMAVLAAGLALWGLPLLGLGLVPGALGRTLLDMAAFHTGAALVTFGGAYAVLPWVQQAAVHEYGWLDAPAMLDALALGETTPGPLIMVVAFVGYLGGHAAAGGEHALMGGVAAALVATWYTFLPSFVFILGGAPWVERTREMPRFAAPLAAVSAVVLGVMVDLALDFAAAACLDASGTLQPVPVAIAFAAGLALFGLGWSVPRVVLLAAVGGLLGATIAP